jgi:hypothetical protein
VGAGFRGGDFFYSAAIARVSDRYYAAYANSDRIFIFGGRGVRSAP